MTGIGYIFRLSGYRCDSVKQFLNSEYYFKYCPNSTKLLTICKTVKSQAYHRDTDCSSFINISIELHLYILHTHILKIYWPLAAKGWIKLLTRHVLLLIHWASLLQYRSFYCILVPLALFCPLCDFVCLCSVCCNSYNYYMYNYVQATSFDGAFYAPWCMVHKKTIIAN